MIQRIRGSKKAAPGISVPDRKLKGLRITLATGLICGIGLSWKLWVSSRLFPLSPVGSLPPIPFPFDYLAESLLLALLVGIVVIPNPRRLLPIFLGFAGLLCLGDQMRWQPWFYQYFFMLAAIAFHAWRRPDLKSSAAALDSCRLIVIATYLWGGLQKLNTTFVHQTWPDMAGAALRLLPGGFTKLPPAFALMVPILEIGIACGLLAARTRKLAVLLAIATHVVVLIVLIASGENTVVWPWNAALIAIVWILFWSDQNTHFFKPFPATIFQAIALALFGLLPALSFVDAWDSYLSAALYSGNIDQAVIYLSPAAIHRLPQPIQPYVWQASPPYFLDINRWAFGELNVPVYAEPRVFRRVAEQICTYAAEDDSSLRLRIFKRPNPLTGVRQSEFYDCDHLRDP